MSTGLCAWAVDPLPWLSGREAALDVFSVRHQRRRPHHARGDDRHRVRCLRPDGQVRRALHGGHHRRRQG